MSKPKKYRMKYVGGRGPKIFNGVRLAIGDILLLPAPYAFEPWLEPVNPIPAAKPPAKKQLDSVFTHKVEAPAPVAADMKSEVDAAFNEELMGIHGKEMPQIGDGSLKPEDPTIEPEPDKDTLEHKVEVDVEVEEPEPEKESEVPLAPSKNDINKMNKKKLVAFIHSKGGLASEELTKAVLTGLASELASKST